MRTAARRSARPARWGGAAAGLVIALLLLGAPRAGGDPVPGRPPAAGPGTDLGGLAFDSDGRLYAADRRGGRGGGPPPPARGAAPPGGRAPRGPPRGGGGPRGRRGAPPPPRAGGGAAGRGAA